MDAEIKIPACLLIWSHYFRLGAFESGLFGVRKLKQRSIPELFSPESDVLPMPDFDVLPPQESDYLPLPPPCKKKRLLYPGDFGEKKMKIASKALLYKTITDETLKIQQNTIRNQRRFI